MNQQVGAKPAPVFLCMCVFFGSLRPTEGQMFLTMYAKNFLAVQIAFDEFAHILWGVKTPIIVMTKL